MKINKFTKLSDTFCNNDYNRKTGKYNLPGVYFWGFTLREDLKIPTSSEEFVCYYIGKSSRNVIERMMQEFTQFIFGGFGTIVKKEFLIKNPFTAYIAEQQLNDTKKVLYSPKGLKCLRCFFDNKSIVETVKWMRESLVFCWIDLEEHDDIKDLREVENKMHHIVRTSVLGIGRIKNRTPKFDLEVKDKIEYFNKINWDDNTVLRDWLIKVNNTIKKSSKRVR